MANEPIIKSYYNFDENETQKDSSVAKEKFTNERIQEEELSIDDEKAFKVGLITVICIVVLGIFILSWWLIKHNQNKEEVLGESINQEQSQSFNPENLKVTEEMPVSSNAAIQPNESSFETYTVQPGDTLYSIGKKFKVDYNKIIELNGIEKTQSLRPGQKLQIPQEK